MVTASRMASLPSWQITQAGGHAHRLVAEGLAAADARGYDFRLLAALADEGPDSQAGLGRRTGIHFSDLVAALNELERRALVRRAPDPADRRRNVVTITAAGRRVLATLDKRIDEVQDRLLAPLTAAERADLVRLLGKLNAYHAQ